MSQVVTTDSITATQLREVLKDAAVNRVIGRHTDPTSGKPVMYVMLASMARACRFCTVVVDQATAAEYVAAADGHRLTAAAALTEVLPGILAELAPVPTH